ncbi:MAG TPA: hypothetical protein VHD56_19460 [Tepidisphaeraceae bacterium]|nr:hypothetical protein [Tepidisphaeraceae bacterium]
MAKPPEKVDVLVLGNHPSAYLATAILRLNKSLSVIHSKIPGEKLVDRLVIVNPALFELSPILKPLKRKLDLVSIYGLRFLADDAAVHSVHVGKSIGAYVGGFKQIHTEMARLTKSGPKVISPSEIQIQRLNESGLEVGLDKLTVHAKLLLLAGELPATQRRMLGLPENWEPSLLHRYSFLRLRGSEWHTLAHRPVIPMSLNLQNTHYWGWLLPGLGSVQVAVEQPSRSVVEHPPQTLLQHWIKVLQQHGDLSGSGGAKIDLRDMVQMDIPLAGALSNENVANRTLCVGPAGGFYSTCAEDIYPNCWSAVCAAETAVNSVREKHLQDALHLYRPKWGATLGDYLRGPQQNLRFLLPLVYRNPTMAARLTEAILSGKSVVR